MTGFGVGEATLSQGSVSVELRSLNHRFLEVRVRMPSELAEHTFFLEQACRERLQRGRYDVAVRVQGSALPQPRLDVERGRELYRALCTLRDELAPGSDVPISVLASIPNVLAAATPSDPGPTRGALSAALDSAIGNLNIMRETEGKALQGELTGRLTEVRAIRAEIASGSPTIVEAYRKRLRERIETLSKTAALKLDPGRLEMEVAVLAERTDIAEELTRLASHFDQFEQLTTEGNPIGRRLDFLLQEISRESNTIGAKCQDACLSACVVRLKADVERLREQVQNVE